MGWDVVEIGLKHDLPVNDPFATAKEIAKRMEQNIRLVYMKRYEYDIENNVVSEAKDFEWIELGKFEANNSGIYLRMEICNYHAKLMLKSVGMDKLRKATFTDGIAEFLWDDIEDTFMLYEIEDRDGNIDIRLSKENVDIGVYVIERWCNWERELHQINTDEDREWLRNYRMQIYNRAKLFGCNEVIICSDQGPAELIYDNMDLGADDLKEYAHSFQYLKDCRWSNESEANEWKKHAKHIMFSSVFQNQLNLSEEDFIEVIYDDFRDIVSP